MPKQRVIRWVVEGNSINVRFGRILDGMASFSFSSYKNVSKSTQNRLLRIMKKYPNRWVYNIWKEGYNEIELWYKEHSESHENGF
jgi:hypothetical protein